MLIEASTVLAGFAVLIALAWKSGDTWSPISLALGGGGSMFAVVV